MQPFSDITVVDLTHVIAGPFCTYQLAVMGADVIKIEPPAAPDMLRARGASEPFGEEGLGPMFTSQNANKRSISIDLKTEQGKDILRRLLGRADVLVENYRSGALDALGFGYKEVQEVKPDIIYCSMTGFGQQGPIGNRTAYDNVIQAYSGLMSASGDADTGPVKVGPPVLDYGTGIQAAFAISAALYQRTHTGMGQRIDIAMLDSAIMLMSANVTYFDQNGQPMPRTGNMSAFNAGYGCYPTREGSIMIGAYTGAQVRNMWIALGDPEHGETLGSLQPGAMADHLQQDSARLASILLQKTAAEWENILNDHRVPAARVRAIDETLAEPQLESRSVVQSVDQDPGNQKFPVASFRYDHGGPRINRLPPVFAQHTREVMGDLGYNEFQIEELAASGVIAIDPSVSA